MADIELLYIRKLRHSRGVFIIQAVAGIHLQSKTVSFQGGPSKPCQFGAFLSEPGVGVSARVKLHRVGPQFFGRFDLSKPGVDKKADLNPLPPETRNDPLKDLSFSDDIESALGRNFTPPLGDHTNFFGLEAERNFHNFRVKGHLQIKRPADRLLQAPQIRILNVPAVFPQVDCNSIRSAPHRLPGRFKRVGPFAPPGLAKRRHVIDIHTQFDHPIRSRTGRFYAGP